MLCRKSSLSFFACYAKWWFASKPEVIFKQQLGGEGNNEVKAVLKNFSKLLAWKRVGGARRNARLLLKIEASC